ncbi:type I restriction endonuclease [Lysinibacillus louembei]|uniref:Type I restriction endonuclease n=1 Tax=Lysinibacillus louembei TaxID=1470088 RepID=A0ABZ0RUH8_9BACI|nr:type I restriction endonuclease [Lysinibacillus louembei]WPK11069.1 type I restriction endonuclease [Lysinibacillus louembei]
MEKFIDQLKNLATRIDSLRGSITTEEATKTAIVMPFFQILGYDVFNPLEFSPEFTADVGIKKGEKVDYAILNDGAPVILIECKSITENLTKHDSQLFRYFGTTSAKFGILTNGIEYKLFTDLEEPNKMDTTPFFTFNILELRDIHIQEVAKFRKETFDLENISSTASDLKYLNALKNYLSVQFETPDEEFVKFLVNQIYDGVKTKSALEKFTPIISKGIKQLINEKVNDKLNAALKSTGDSKVRVTLPDPTEEVQPAPVNEKIEGEGIVTTPEELESYSIIKVLLKDVIAPDRIFYRDNRSYFNIVVDDNIRKWIIRVFFDKNRNYIMLNDAATDKERTIIEFNQPMDLINYGEKIIPLVAAYANS